TADEAKAVARAFGVDQEIRNSQNGFAQVSNYGGGVISGSAYAHAFAEGFAHAVATGEGVFQSITAIQTLGLNAVAQGFNTAYIMGRAQARARSTDYVAHATAYAFGVDQRTRFAAQQQATVVNSLLIRGVADATAYGPVASAFASGYGVHQSAAAGGTVDQSVT